MNKFPIIYFLVLLLFALPSFMEVDAQTILFERSKKGTIKKQNGSQKALTINPQRAGQMKKNGKILQNFSSFEEYKEVFFKIYWSLNPEYASYLGLSKFDTYLTIPNQAYRLKAEQTYQQLLEQLYKLEAKVEFSIEDKTDCDLIKNQLESSIWYDTVFRSFEWNPSIYNIGGGFDRLVGDKEMPLKEKISKLYAKMKNVPAYYKAAIQNIKNPTLEHTQLAAFRIGGTLGVFDEKIRDLVTKAKKEDWEKVKSADFEKRLTEAIAAIQMFEMYLNQKILPSLAKRDHVRSFRIGEEMFDKKFQYDIWGDTVNVAARMETAGEPGKINISRTTRDLIAEKFHCV
ncbi:MAG: DUF885 family protein, partial [Chitinophagales bacterium]